MTRVTRVTRVSPLTGALEHAGSATRRAEELSLSFESIYRDHAGYVLHSLRRLGVNDRDLEDIAQEVFILIGRKLSEYDTTRPLRPWIFGIAFRFALDYRRSARVRHESLENPPDAIDASAAPDHLVEERDRQRLVLAALQTLSVENRAVFVLHDIDGTTVPKIAEALELPLNTTYSRLRLARAQFAAAVRELERGEP